MKKIVLLIILLGNVCIAQETNDSSNQVSLITNSKYVFMKNNQEYKLKDYSKVFTNAEAIKHIKKARTNHVFGNILGFIGGFGLGYGIGSAISVKSSDVNAKSRRKESWIIAGSGLCVIGASIPLAISFKKNINKGVEIENSQNENILSEAKLNVIIDHNGAGLSLSF